MVEFPIIVNYDIPFGYREIINNILKEENYIIISDFKIYKLLNKEPHEKIILNHIELNQLQHLIEYNIFFYMFTNDNNNSKQFKEMLFKNNISNVIFLSKPFNWIFPELKVKQKNKMLIQFPASNKIIRSIAQLAGYKFLNLKDINSLVSFLEQNHTLFEEILLLIDLDHSNDIERLLYELNRICFIYGILKNNLHIILLKDIEKNFSFSLPNFIVQKKQYYHLPEIKKIFNHIEIILYLIESLLFYDKKQNIEHLYFNFFSLREFLYGSISIENIIQRKKLSIQKFQVYFSFYKKALPVIWLYDYLLEKIDESKTIILK
ncbi:MAG: hypothetical protein KatS3mg129_1883 [Leptospiraceae bacterium]|nr:MAG: hypothetical protein KatS3mg129_1883 [Leptospiraceae bacterium]